MKLLFTATTFQKERALYCGKDDVATFIPSIECEFEEIREELHYTSEILMDADDCKTFQKTANWHLWVSKRTVKRYWTHFILMSLTMAAIITYSVHQENVLTYIQKDEATLQALETNALCPDNLSPLWREMNSLISGKGLFSRNYDISLIKQALRCAKIIDIERLRVQNAYKWLVTLEGGQKVLYKPLLLSKGEQVRTCNTDCEHPEYEVTAFVMNRLLGFNNMPITVGRQISWFDDVFPVASKRFGKGMTIKNGTDVCFEWRCPSKKVSREFCFHKGIILGSATVWLNKAIHIVYPHGKENEKYQYHDFHFYAKAKELPIGVDRFCLEFRTRHPYNDDRMFYHVIDMAAIDYLLNNVDQRHTYIIGDDGLTITNVMIDFGQSFCLRSVILLGAPIYQCCSIRKSTFDALYRLKNTLTEEFDNETRDDPIYPLLLPKLFLQMQARLRELVSFLDFCIAHKGLENVVFD